MLFPIYQLLFGEHEQRGYEQSLKLTEDQISISYKTYKSNRADDRQVIIDEKLAPGNYQQLVILRR